MPKVLMVEDDKDLTFLVDEWLSADKYTLDICHDGLEGYEYLRQGAYDLIILDWDLPGMTGVEICRKFRQSNGTTPILMLTGKTRIDDKEHGLDSGADDYLSKPFHMRELTARLRALSRRPAAIVGSRIEVGHLVMDLTSHKLLKNGEEVHLTPKEFSLMELLMRHPGEVFSGDAILQRVWPMDSESTSDAVRTAVRRIRQKLDDSDDESKSIIEGMRKVGYRLNVQSN